MLSGVIKHIQVFNFSQETIREKIMRLPRSGYTGM